MLDCFVIAIRLLLNEIVVLLVCHSQCSNQQAKGRKGAKEREREKFYTCHIQKSHMERNGMERNAISACANVPLNVACSHVFRSWYEPTIATASTAEAATAVVVVYISNSMHKRQAREKIMLDFILNGGWKSETYKNQINSLDVVSEEMQNVCVGIEKKTSDWKERKSFFSLWQKHGIMCIIRSVRHTLSSTGQRRECV